MIAASAEGIRTIFISLVVNVILCVTKVSVGIFARSHALVADGIHSLVDLASDIAAMIGLRIADLPKDDDHPYGHHRISTLATLLISSLVLTFCVGLAWHSVTSLVVGSLETSPPDMAAAWVAGGALILKEVFYRYARRQAERLGSRLLMANAVDHRADAVASLLALVAVVVSRFYPSLAGLDQVMGLVLAGWLGSEGVRLFRDACQHLVDQAPDEAVLKDLSEHILAVPGVRGFHAFRARHLGDRLEVDFHLQVDATCTVGDGHAIAGRVKAEIRATHPEVVSILVHVEPNEPQHLKSEGHSGIK